MDRRLAGAFRAELPVLRDRKANAFRRTRVLIADSDTVARDQLRRAIEADGGFDVCAEAADAAGAVSTALRKRPDICVLGIRLPGGGVAATWEIGGRLPQAKVVLLGETAGDSELFAALRAGAEGYLLKTADFANVPSALWDLWAGEAVIDPALVARLLRHFRNRGPRWRRPVGAAPGEGSQPGEEGAHDARLTSREWEVLDLLAHDLSTADISRELMISATAVRVHIAAIVRKLGVPDRAAAVETLRCGAGGKALRQLNARLPATPCDRVADDARLSGRGPPRTANGHGGRRCRPNERRR